MTDSPDQHPDLTAAARRLARSALLHTEREQRRLLIGSLARSVREATASAAPHPSETGARRALAKVVSALPPEGQIAEIADLRLFARLSLPECADLLRIDQRILAARWRAMKSALFAAARRAVREGD